MLAFSHEDFSQWRSGRRRFPVIRKVPGDNDKPKPVESKPVNYESMLKQIATVPKSKKLESDSSETDSDDPPSTKEEKKVEIEKWVVSFFLLFSSFEIAVLAYFSHFFCIRFSRYFPQVHKNLRFLLKFTNLSFLPENQIPNPTLNPIHQCQWSANR